MLSLRPKEWVIAELEDKLLVQQATGTALLNDFHQRRSDLINSKLKCRFDNSAHIYTVFLCYSAIKSWPGSTVDPAVQENLKG